MGTFFFSIFFTKNKKEGGGEILRPPTGHNFGTRWTGNKLFSKVAWANGPPCRPKEDSYPYLCELRLTPHIAYYPCPISDVFTREMPQLCYSYAAIRHILSVAEKTCQSLDYRKSTLARGSWWHYVTANGVRNGLVSPSTLPPYFRVSAMV